jgi:2-(1,2-epoxy-1,2-dihydrophenyl)acetyl-CoA isomerase
MEYKTIIVNQDKGVTTVTLNRPEKLNAFSPTMGWEVVDAITKASTDANCKVVLFNASGRAFCAGGDVDADLSQSVALKPKWRAGNDWKFLNTLPHLLRYLPQPTIVAMHGWCIGIGVSLPLCCDIRFAAESAKLSLRFVRLGNAPEMGSTWTLPRLVGVSKAIELAITGDTIDAKEALRIGMINRVYPDSEIQAATMDFARSIAEGASVSVELIKRGIYMGLTSDFHSAIQYECFAAETVRETEDMVEGVKAVMEKRKPNFKGR